MYQQLVRWLKQFEKFANRPWYLPLVAFFAFIDIFVWVIPIDPLLVSAAAFRRHHWLRVAATVTLGSALGALAMALVIRYFGQGAFSDFFAHQIGPERWKQTEHFFEHYGGWTFFVLAGGPFMLAPGAVIGGSVHTISLWNLFISTFTGRLLKYALFCWLATHAPHVLKKIFRVNLHDHHDSSESKKS